MRITVRKATYAVAELLQLVETSPERVEPFCRVFGTCGGCQTQHLSYDAQLRWKRDLVREALERIGDLTNVSIAETIGSPAARSYRNKVALVVDRHLRDTAVGFYRARSHEVVPIDECPIVAPQLSEYIGRLAAPADAALTALLAEARHVIARSASRGDAVVSVTTETASAGLERNAQGVVDALPGAVGLVNTYDLASANAIAGRRARVLAGSETIEEEIGGIRYRVSPSSFFQINVAIVGRIFACIERDLADARRVVDLYCGMGTFSLLFARLGARVSGVEESRRAIDEARSNALLNDLESRASFTARRADEWVRSLAGRSALATCDLVFLDPPRKGSDEVTLQAVAGARVSRIGYLSCDPATLARDLRALVANGYALRGVQPFDMFPQTGHVETLVVLERER